MSELRKIGRLVGLNNRLPPSELPHLSRDGAQLTWLSEAENIDLDDAGVARRRRGTTLLHAGAAHSLWSDAQAAFVALGQRLMDVRQPEQPRLVREGVGQRLAYARLPTGDVAWTDGQWLRRVRASDGQDAPLAPDTPAASAAAVAEGSLPAGRYLWCVCAADAHGRLSAPTPVHSSLLAAGGGLQASVLTTPRAVAHLYISGPNGETLALAATAQADDAGAATLRARQLPDESAVCPTLDLQPLPAGQALAFHLGRLLVARESVLWWSQPWHEGLMDAARNYLALPGRITLLRPLGMNLFLADGQQTYVLRALDGALQPVLPVGALPGSDSLAPDGLTAFWDSPRGLVRAQGDEVELVQDSALQMTDAATRSASCWREQAGQRHVLTARSRGGAGDRAMAVAELSAELVKGSRP